MRRSSLPHVTLNSSFKGLPYVLFHTYPTTALLQRGLHFFLQTQPTASCAYTDGRRGADYPTWGIKVDIHSTFSPGIFLYYDAIKNGVGKGEGDQPIKQKCREYKWSVRGPGYLYLGRRTPR